MPSIERPDSPRRLKMKALRLSRLNPEAESNTNCRNAGNYLTVDTALSEHLNPQQRPYGNLKYRMHCFIWTIPMCEFFTR
jgi:hypothetical protein